MQGGSGRGFLMGVDQSIGRGNWGQLLDSRGDSTRIRQDF